jgi:D-alanyl-D-alanine carboxypeptidase/D-alanyl-D-alanine-endopeptidase (penicillin-binding protein 4)
MRLIATGLALLALVCGPESACARQDELPPRVLQALATAGVPADALTGLAVPLGASNWPWQRWERHADRPVQPGSTIKLLTSAVALDRLGPNFRGRTELLSRAPVDGDVLRGDLVLRGGADADLGVAQLWALLNEVRDSGVRVIAGDVLLDRSLFQPERRDLGLAPFDDAPEFAYNVIPDALNLNGSLLELEIRSDGQSLSARSLPRLLGVELSSAMTLSDDGCAAWSAGWQAAQVREKNPGLAIELRGRFPKNCTIRTYLQLTDRDLLTEALVRTLWTQLGGQLDGAVRAGQAAPDARVLARRWARPWGELLRPLNKQSDNALTRLLYLQLGAAAAGSEHGTKASNNASTDTLAEREVRRWLANNGLDDASLVLDNGSGLSRQERLSARLLVGVLQRVLAGPHAADLMMSLPAVGVDGTMRNRLKSSPATAWTRLKTGTLRNVAALAGVVHDGQRQPWVVVLNINHEQAPRARPALDALVDWLVRGRPAPATPEMP